MKNSESRLGRERTVIEDTPPRNDRRETKMMSSRLGGEGRGERGEGDTRQIVGVVITYSWRSEGQLFPIRAGKNFIGRGEIGSEADHRNCDILVAQDEKMSGEHALILCQQGRYQLIDQMSSNGTVLNGELLLANQATELENYAAIQTGNTLWTFIRIDLPKKTGESSSGSEAGEGTEKKKKVQKDSIVY